MSYILFFSNALCNDYHYPEQFLANGIKADLMIPVFITKYLPHGLIGILIVGILSAAMSSLSSTINSLGELLVLKISLTEVLKK